MMTSIRNWCQYATRQPFANSPRASIPCALAIVTLSVSIACGARSASPAISTTSTITPTLAPSLATPPLDGGGPQPYCLPSMGTIDAILPTDGATTFCEQSSCFSLRHADGVISGVTDRPARRSPEATIQASRPTSKLCIVDDCVQLNESAWSASDSNSNYLTVADRPHNGAKASFPLGPNVSLNSSKTTAIVRIQAPNDPMVGRFFVYDVKTGARLFELKLQSVGTHFRCSHPGSFLGDNTIAVERFDCDNQLPRKHYSGNVRFDLYTASGALLSTITNFQFPIGSEYPRDKQYITEEYPAFAKDFDPKNAVFVDFKAGTIERKNWLTGETLKSFSVDLKKWFPHGDFREVVHQGKVILANESGALLVAVTDGKPTYFPFPRCAPPANNNPM